MTTITISAEAAQATAPKHQRKPASESSKSSTRSWGQGVWPEVPLGYVVRNGQGISARPVRRIGPRDSDIVTLAIQSFGFLLPPGAVDTLAGFASRIELYTANPKARAVADTLHRFSA